jgi:tight adherence protein C
MSPFFFVAFLSVAGAAFLVVEALTHPARERRSAVARASTYGRVRRSRLPDRGDLHERAVVPIKDVLARWVLRLTPKLSLESVSTKLLTAGLTRRLSPTGFLSLKAALVIGGLLLGALFLGNMLYALMGAAALFFAPDIYVTFKARKRKEEARVQLPDALDILAVSVEAGLAFDGAITKLIEHMHGPLAEEFALTLGEMRVGRSRHEALKNLATRLDTPEIGNFTRAIIQADQLGISLGKILRVQASDTRMRRQAAAEEKAMKAPIKMIPPTAIFIFPAIFLVVLGPAFLNLGEVFSF